MRTFIIGVLLLIERQYNFIYNTPAIPGLIIGLVVIAGILMAVAQDVRDLRNWKINVTVGDK